MAQALRTFHSAGLGVMDSQEESTGVVVVGMVVVTVAVVGDAGRGVFCGLGVGLGIEPSKYLDMPRRSAAIVTRFFQVIQFIPLNFEASEKVGGALVLVIL
jgi:hypothetical protein